MSYKFIEFLESIEQTSDPHLKTISNYLTENGGDLYDYINLIHAAGDGYRYKYPLLTNICAAAIHYGEIEIIKHLSNIGFNFDQTTGKNETLLTYCFLSGKQEILNFLIHECDSKKFYYNFMKDTCVLDNEEMLNFILEFYEPNDKDLLNVLSEHIKKVNKVTPVFHTIFERISDIGHYHKYLITLGKARLEIIKFFLDAGINILTPELMKEAENAGNMPLVEFCLENGIRPSSIVIDNLLTNKELINLYLRYNVDLSAVDMGVDEKVKAKARKDIDKLGKLGLDTTSLYILLYDNHRGFYDKDIDD